MSAPEMNALPPAPVTTTTRTSSSRAKSSRMRVAASHMSSDTALWRSGLLKITVPTLPSRRASTLSLRIVSFILISPAPRSYRIGLAQRGDLARLEPELLEHRIGVLAEVGGRRHELARRPRQR